MDGLIFLYKNKSGTMLEITPQVPQFLFLEPFEKVVLRLYFKKNGIDVEQTKMLRQSVDPSVISVTVRNTSAPFISRISDFKDITNGLDKEVTFAIDFEEKKQTFVDVLFESLVEDRLKVKLSTVSEGIDSFENENTVTDGPDAFVKLVSVIIRPDAVVFTLVYRRSGRLVQFNAIKTYASISEILKDRMVNEFNLDRTFEYTQIERKLIEENWKIDRINNVIYREEGLRKIEITSEEFGDVIRRSASILEILYLLKTNSPNDNITHPFYKEAVNNLQKGSSESSMPPADVKNTSDLRGL